jgi:hypothetical protein
MLNSFWGSVGERGDLKLISRASGFEASSFEALGAAISQSAFASKGGWISTF